MYNAVNQNFYSHGKIFLKNFFGSWKFNQSHTDITEPAKSPHPSNSHFQELADIFKCFWKKNPFSMALALLLLKQSSWVSFFFKWVSKIAKANACSWFQTCFIHIWCSLLSDKCMHIHTFLSAFWRFHGRIFGPVPLLAQSPQYDSCPVVGFREEAFDPGQQWAISPSRVLYLHEIIMNTHPNTALSN